MGKSKKDATLEACAGALQNLTASKGLVSGPHAGTSPPPLPRTPCEGGKVGGLSVWDPAPPPCHWA